MLLRRLASHAEQRSTASDEQTTSLTARERQVLELICEGLSNKEIAQVCSISEATVKNHVHHLLEKQKLRTRTQLAARANLSHRAAARRHR
jgi:DNA-binding NarL/FixJ family response regulator